MTEREILVSPETIFGDKFRVPAIIGLGSELGYQFSNLHLPVGWQEKIPNLKKASREDLQELFELDCRNFRLSSAGLKFDEETNLLTQASLKTGSENSDIYLETPYYGLGFYRGENVRNLAAAVVLQNVASRFLNQIDSETQYAHLDGTWGKYFSVDLGVPKIFLDSKEKLTSDYWQYRFEVEASNIAGRFGESIESLKFSDNGILRSIKLTGSGTDDTYYRLSEAISGYNSHNVFSLSQAAALHGIGASFINKLMNMNETR